MNRQSKKDIRNLLLIIFFGSLFGIITAVSFVTIYGSTGRYIVKNTLISPEAVLEVARNDRLQDSAPSRILFTYFDFKAHARQTKLVKTSRYKKFYQIVSDAKSIREVSQEMKNLFISPSAEILTLSISRGSSPLVQEVRFSQKGDYFRIALIDTDPENRWAYFYYPHIYEDVKKIMTEEDEII